MRDQVDLEELLALRIGRLQVLLVSRNARREVVLTSSTVFPMPIPALLISTVASPCV